MDEPEPASLQFVAALFTYRLPLAASTTGRVAAEAATIASETAKAAASRNRGMSWRIMVCAYRGAAFRSSGSWAMTLTRKRTNLRRNTDRRLH